MEEMLKGRRDCDDYPDSKTVGQANDIRDNVCHVPVAIRRDCTTESCSTDSALRSCFRIVRSVSCKSPTYARIAMARLTVESSCSKLLMRSTTTCKRESAVNWLSGEG